MLLTPAIIRCIIRHRSGLYTCIQYKEKQEKRGNKGSLRHKKALKRVRKADANSGAKASTKGAKGARTHRARTKTSRGATSKSKAYPETKTAHRAEKQKGNRYDQEEPLQQPSGAASV